MLLMAWAAALHPAFWPAHNCRQPAASASSGLISATMAFPMIRLNTSPIPIGLTPEGAFSNGISLFDK